MNWRQFENVLLYRTRGRRRSASGRSISEGLLSNEQELVLENAVVTALAGIDSERAVATNYSESDGSTHCSASRSPIGQGCGVFSLVFHRVRAEINRHDSPACELLVC